MDMSEPREEIVIIHSKCQVEARLPDDTEEDPPPENIEKGGGGDTKGGK